MRISPLIVCIILAPTLAAAAENASLAQARSKVEDLDYAGALKLLDAALDVEGNEREVLLEIYELRGVSWATMGKPDKARDAFRALLVLDPAHTLAGAQPPRVKTPFYEAKEWVGKAGAVKLVVEPEKKGDQVVSLTVRVPVDGLGLARAVALHVDVDGARRDEKVPLELSTRTATLEVGAATFRWWAEVLGDRGAVLLRSGTEEAPNVVEPAKVPDVPVAVQLLPQPVEAKAPAGTAQRVAGVTVGVAGLGAVAVGAIFGGISAGARHQIATAARDEQGNVIGITQRKAADLDAQARDLGAAANVLLIGGALMAGAGLLLVLFAPSDQVEVAPAPGGAVVSGRF